jgi:hypothetical protein
MRIVSFDIFPVRGRHCRSHHYLKYDPDPVRDLSQAAGDFLELCLEFFESRTGKTLPRSRELLEEFFLVNYSHCIRRME